MSLSVRALNRVDLPTFGRPTIAIDKLIDQYYTIKELAGAAASTIILKT